MIGKIFLAVAVLQSLSFGFDDDDFDGVENKFDKCPATNILEIVDDDGCAIKDLNPSFELTISLYNFKKDGIASNSQSLSANVYYQDLNLEANFSTNDSLQNDSQNSSDTMEINIFYALPLKSDIAVWLGTGISVPMSKTQTNDKNDYSLYANFSKYIETMDLFGGLSYKIINDTDEFGEKFRNTFGYYFGIKHYIKDKISCDLQYATTQNELSGEESLDYLYTGVNFNLIKNWFARIEYGSGLSKTADDFSFGTKLGYVF
ncbi:MAG: hypothetical protein L0Y61_03090 [Epsilonproteobacteria bacterium]|nr:hypothetical protein [Campylobacterota bacterium]